MAKVFGWLPDKYSEMWSLIAYGCLVITGRNEVVAKVIFLHLSVIHSVHRGEGVCLSACWDTTTPPDQADPPRPGRPPRTRQMPPRTRQMPPQTRQTPTPQTRQTPLDQADTPLDQADPPDQADSPPRTRQTPPGSRLQHMVYERPVRILLECILVLVRDFCETKHFPNYYILLRVVTEEGASGLL